MTTSPAHWLSEQQRLGRDLYLILDPLAEAELRASRPASGTSLNLYEGSEVSHLAAIGPRLVGVEDAEADWLLAWLTQPERNWGCCSAPSRSTSSDWPGTGRNGRWCGSRAGMCCTASRTTA